MVTAKLVLHVILCFVGLVLTILSYGIANAWEKQLDKNDILARIGIFYWICVWSTPFLYFYMRTMTILETDPKEIPTLLGCVVLNIWILWLLCFLCQSIEVQLVLFPFNMIITTPMIFVLIRPVKPEVKPEPLLGQQPQEV